MSVEWWWKVKIESHVCLLIACIVCLVHTHGEVATGGSAAVWTCEVLGGGLGHFHQSPSSILAKCKPLADAVMTSEFLGGVPRAGKRRRECGARPSAVASATAPSHIFAQAFHLRLKSTSPRSVGPRLSAGNMTVLGMARHWYAGWHTSVTLVPASYLYQCCIMAPPSEHDITSGKRR